MPRYRELDGHIVGQARDRILHRAARCFVHEVETTRSPLSKSRPTTMPALGHEQIPLAQRVPVGNTPVIIQARITDTVSGRTRGV
jgi:hypothetical protein